MFSEAEEAIEDLQNRVTALEEKDGDPVLVEDVRVLGLRVDELEAGVTPAELAHELAQIRNEIRGLREKLVTWASALVAGLEPVRNQFDEEVR